MASTIGIPSAPVLRGPSDNVTLVSSRGFPSQESSRYSRVKSAATGVLTRSAVVFSYQEMCLKNISAGLQLHQALLSALSSRVECRDQVDALKADITDLVLEIHKVGEWMHYI